MCDFRTGGYKILFLFFLLFVGSGYIFPADPDAAEISAWLQGEPQAEYLRGEEPRIREIFAEARSRSVPGEILFERLKEGAAKRAAPEVLLRSLREETERLAAARRIILSAGPAISAAAREISLLKTSSLALRGGFSEKSLFEVLRAASDSGKGPAGAIELLPLLIRMQGIEPLPEASVGAFGLALFSGRLPPAQYGSLLSLYLKAAAGKLAGDVTLRLMADILRTGGGLVQIERELTRRIKRP